MRSPVQRFLTVGGSLTYAFLLLVFGIVLAGAGDGTYLLIFVFSAPLRFVSLKAAIWGTAVLWVVIGLIVAKLEAPSARRTLVAVLAIHYLGVLGAVLTVQGVELRRFAELSKIHPVLTTTALLLYLVGQMLIWLLYTRAQSSAQLQVRGR
jgi:hypothetical protein